MKGHVRERGAGNWYAVIDVRDSETGKRKRKWHSLPGCSGKRQAQIECARIISEINGGLYLEPSKTTVGQFLLRWCDHIQTQVSPKSYERYSEIAKKNLTPLLGSIVITKLTPAQISAAYAKALTNGRLDGTGGLSARTVGHLHRVLKQALGQAVKWQVLSRNPADAVDPPKVEKKAMQVYDLTDTISMISQLRGNPILLPALLAVLCGLRRGEAAALRWRAVDLDKAQMSIAQSVEQTLQGIRVKPPKSGKARTVALSATMVDELKAHRLAQAQQMLKLGVRLDGHSFVCAHADGSMMTPMFISQQWARAVRKTTLSRITFHDLRHAHATHLLGSGVHPKVASERLGHSKVGITLDLYSHVLPGMQEDAAAKVDAALKAAQPKPNPILSA